MNLRAEAIVDQLGKVLRASPPAGVTVRDVDGFMKRMRAALVAMIGDELLKREANKVQPPDEWKPARRTDANLAAMRVLSRLVAEKRDATAEERGALAGYSGWGGLSLAGINWPPGVPQPDPRGLIHEYYTPSKIAAAIAGAIRPLLPGLVNDDGVVPAVEPSAGIGRFVRALSGNHGAELVRWTAVEYSPLAALMLGKLRPDVEVYEGPFERWIRDHGGDRRGKVNLVVCNPPYGARGASKVDDPERDYRETKADAYFIRRSLWLLPRGGLAVFLIPFGLMTGRAAANRTLREKCLKIAHLAAAYRLPGVDAGDLGSGDEDPTRIAGYDRGLDVVLFRGRGGSLHDVDPADEFILDGHYFRDTPDHVLGVEETEESAVAAGRAKPRFGYEVRGEWKGLPVVVEREVCAACHVIDMALTKGPTPKGGAVRAIVESYELAEHVASANALGLRIDRYLALLASDDVAVVDLWPELDAAIGAWSTAHGNPHADKDVKVAAKSDTNVGLQRFLAAFDPKGERIATLRKAPAVERKVEAPAGDVLALAEAMFRAAGQLVLGELARTYAERVAAYNAASGKGPKRSPLRDLDDDAIVARLLDAEWCIDPPAGALDDKAVLKRALVWPRVDYVVGDLWPRYDRAKGLRAKGGSFAEAADRQLRWLDAAIAPVTYDDIADGVSPREAWIPLDIVSTWVSTTGYGSRTYTLVRKDGLVQVDGVEYEELESLHIAGIIGWINHDFTLFRPSKRRDEDIDDVRIRVGKEYMQQFRAFVAQREADKQRIEQAYNRTFRGFVTPTFSGEPMNIARWNPHKPLRAVQNAGARRVLHHRAGLIAFDVGVGKTRTGLAVIARARQEGWCKRPVIVVPNTVVWNWVEEAKAVLPDYRIGIIGSKPWVVSRGPRKGQLSSQVDTADERAAKWSRFQGGEYDIMLVAYSALGRSRMNETAVRRFVDRTAAIQRQIRLRQRNAKGSSKKLSERQEAILHEGAEAWIAEKLELPEGWEYDKGITWDTLGIDLLMVDEAQNFKNLYLPEPREHGVPKYMGAAGEGSDRAWQVQFRAAAVRAKTGGTGVVLLSATPAKNSPLEFYNLIQYVDENAWDRQGIHDPEAFIDRYLKIETKSVIGTTLDPELKSAVVGFQNLNELRDTIFRYGEFKTAEQAGIVLPEPKVELIELPMNNAQETKYQHYVALIENALGDRREAGKILGYLARMALIAIHPKLDEGFDWESAGKSDVDPHSNKLDACAGRIAKKQECGHIVFVDNLAVHRWLVRVLEAKGVPSDRIAVLNGKTAKAPADRQRIAREFNGDPELGIAPKYDVVIANAVAYEGINLQTRTCAIHHLDLPWEPATLQQRNGRGVRQGNKLDVVGIYYYFSQSSLDGLRFDLIRNKRGWMVALLESQDRETNNPGAQMELGPDEVLILISRDKEKARLQIAARKEKLEQERKGKVALDASRQLRAAAGRFARARLATDPIEGARFRAEAESRLADLARVDVTAWPWQPWAAMARDRAMLVSDGDVAPVYEGLRCGVPRSYDPSTVDFREFGRVSMGDRLAIGIRDAGNARWNEVDAAGILALGLRPEHSAAAWPGDEDDKIKAAIDRDYVVRSYTGYGGSSSSGYPATDWARQGWPFASEDFLAKWWPYAASKWLAMWRVQFYGGKVPMISGGQLRLVDRDFGRYDADAIVPPTDAGFARFLALAPSADRSFGDLKECAAWWWNRRVPQDMLTRGKEAAAAAK